MNTLKRTIHITQTDMGRLRSLLDTMRNSREDLKTLRAELDSAQVTGPYEMPADVITMNSKVQLRDLATDEVMEYTIVFPTKANADEGLISVLAPIGTAAPRSRPSPRVRSPRAPRRRVYPSVNSPPVHRLWST